MVIITLFKPSFGKGLDAGGVDGLVEDNEVVDPALESLSPHPAEAEVAGATGIGTAVKGGADRLGFPIDE